MKKILILCDNFPPYWAPRVGYLVKYIKKYGYIPYVISCQTNDRILYEFLTNYAEKEYIINAEKLKRYDPRNIIESLLPRRKSRGEYEMEKLATELLEKTKIDLIFCTTSMILPCYTAYKISKKNKIPLVLDFRDIPEQLPRKGLLVGDFPSFIHEIHARLSYPLYKFYRRIVVKNSKKITTVSKFHKRVLDHINNNCEIIYNGFDPELFKPSTQPKTDKFTITYTGSLGNRHDRNPSHFLDAIKQLDLEKKINPNKFGIKFYTEDPTDSYLYEEIKARELLDYFHFHNFVDAHLIPEILAEASMLLLLSKEEDEKGPKGILQTKFFEYLAVNRPIICSSSDNGEIAEIIEKSRAGVASRNSQDIYSFVLANYNLWSAKGSLKWSSNLEEIKRYSREAQAQQFAKIFDVAIISSS